MDIFIASLGLAWLFSGLASRAWNFAKSESARSQFARGEKRRTLAWITPPGLLRIGTLIMGGLGFLAWRERIAIWYFIINGIRPFTIRTVAYVLLGLVAAELLKRTLLELGTAKSAQIGGGEDGAQEPAGFDPSLPAPKGNVVLLGGTVMMAFILTLGDRMNHIKGFGFEVDAAIAAKPAEHKVQISIMREQAVFDAYGYVKGLNTKTIRDDIRWAQYMQVGQKRSGESRMQNVPRGVSVPAAVPSHDYTREAEVLVAYDEMIATPMKKSIELLADLEAEGNYLPTYNSWARAVVEPLYNIVTANLKLHDPNFKRDSVRLEKLLDDAFDDFIEQAKEADKNLERKVSWHGETPASPPVSAPKAAGQLARNIPACECKDRPSSARHCPRRLRLAVQAPHLYLTVAHLSARIAKNWRDGYDVLSHVDSLCSEIQKKGEDAPVLIDKNQNFQNTIGQMALFADQAALEKVLPPIRKAMVISSEKLEACGTNHDASADEFRKRWRRALFQNKNTYCYFAATTGEDRVGASKSSDELYAQLWDASFRSESAERWDNYAAMALDTCACVKLRFGGGREDARTALMFLIEAAGYARKDKNQDHTLAVISFHQDLAKEIINE